MEQAEHLRITSSTRATRLAWGQTSSIRLVCTSRSALLCPNEKKIEAEGLPLNMFSPQETEIEDRSIMFERILRT
jgi:hypothetical protein